MTASNIALITLTVALLLAACDSGRGDPNAVRTRVPDTFAPPATGLTEYNDANPLRVEGRDKLRACVEAVGGGCKRGRSDGGDRRGAADRVGRC